MSGGWDVPRDDARVESCKNVPCLRRMAGGIMTMRTVHMASNLDFLINFVKGGKRAVGEENGTWRCGELWRSTGHRRTFCAVDCDFGWG